MKRLLLPLALAAALAPFAATGKAPAKPFKDCRDCPGMVRIAPGAFDMGADAGEEGRYEGPVHRVTIAKPFAIGVDPVTNAQYRAFVKATGHKSATDCIVPMEGTYKAVKGADWTDPQLGRKLRDDEPVVCVDWNDARAYVGWLAKKTGKPYRLLSEAEWEYVARAGRMTRFPWGDDPLDGCANANLMDASAPAEAHVEGKAVTCSDGYANLAPVGRVKPNAFGAREMVGNAWTWVEDCYEMPYPAAAPTDGSAYTSGACDRRSVRGASWATNVTRARPTFRGRDPVDRVSSLFSIRVARDLP